MTFCHAGLRPGIHVFIPSPAFDFRLFTCDYSPAPSVMPGYDPASMASFPVPLFTFDFSLVTILRLSTFHFRLFSRPICHAGLRPGIHGFVPGPGPRVKPGVTKKRARSDILSCRATTRHPCFHSRSWTPGQARGDNEADTE